MWLAAGNTEELNRVRAEIRRLAAAYNLITKAACVPSRMERTEAVMPADLTKGPESGIINAVSEARESSIGIVNNQRLYATTPEIQAFTGIDSAVEYFSYKNKWADKVSPIDKESFSTITLSVLKEFCEGLHWAQVHFGINNEMPRVIRYAKLGKGVLGDYEDTGRELRLRRGIGVEHAFTTGVHEMAHHADNIMGHPATDIVKAACKKLSTLNKDYTMAQLNKLKNQTAAGKWEDDHELLAYSVEKYCVGKGNQLAKEIAEEFLRRCGEK